MGPRRRAGGGCGPCARLLGLRICARGRGLHAWLFGLLLFSGCAASVAPAPADREPEVWRYRVRLEGEALFVEAVLPRCDGLSLDEETARFISERAIRGSAPCTLSYRFALFDAGETFANPMIAAARHGAVIAPASTWLLHPARATAGARFTVELDPSTPAELGLAPIAGASHTYGAEARMLWKSPMAIFGAFRVHALGPNRVAIAGRDEDAFELGDRGVLAWIEAAAENVTAYYGRFPVPRVLQIVVPVEGDELGFASVLGNGGASIVSPVGRAIDARTLALDWQMTHEMTHLAFPNLARKHRWLEEGMATYVEPFARVQLQRISAEKMWSELINGLPKGQPERGDQGLDNTHTWGRTYWGGALFCFVADVEIRKRTDNVRSIRDAFRAVLEAGGDVRVDWPIEQVIELGDRATGTTVLAETYAAMANDAVRVDLSAIFAALGVSGSGRSISFDDRAPLAAIRRSMTSTAAGHSERNRARAN